LINRVFDFLLKEKASDVGSSLKGLMVSVAVKTTFTSMNSSQIIEEDKEPSTARFVAVVVLAVVQVFVLAIVLCPLAVLYMLGMYLSSGISLWRLIQHDYGNPDGGANLKPALNVLYSLAVAQGVVYGYRSIYDLVARTGLVEVVAKDYSLERYLVSEYLDETVAGCMKDPSFARGRNLVTYAVELLMESKSRYDYVSGILILSTVVTDLWSARSGLLKQLLTGSASALLKQLLTGSASFSHVVQRLLETFGPTSPYSTEIRVRAARIVATVAGSIRLDQLPQGMMIECISSLLDTFEEYSWRPEGYERRRDVPKEYERDWLLDGEELLYIFSVDAPPRATDESDSRNPLQGYRDLVVQGLRILRKVAVNENNCRVISNTEGLVSKTMAHLTSDKLHMDHHDEWYSIAEESLEFMNRFMATLGAGTETTNLTSEISSSSQAAIMRTLGCPKCHMRLKRKATQVLLHRPLVDIHTPPSIVPGASSSKIFVWILLHIFLLPDYPFVRRICDATHLLKKSSYTTRLAGEKMQAMISSITEASDTSMLPSVVYVIGSLARTVAGAENKAYRIHAAMILKDLCRYYTKDDEYLKELKKSVANVMEEVINVPVHKHFFM